MIVNLSSKKFHSWFTVNLSTFADGFSLIWRHMGHQCICISCTFKTNNQYCQFKIVFYLLKTKKTVARIVIEAREGNVILNSGYCISSINTIIQEFFYIFLNISFSYVSKVLIVVIHNNCWVCIRTHQTSCQSIINNS